MDGVANGGAANDANINKKDQSSLASYPDNNIEYGKTHIYDNKQPQAEWHDHVEGKKDGWYVDHYHIFFLLYVCCFVVVEKCVRFLNEYTEDYSRPEYKKYVNQLQQIANHETKIFPIYLQDLVLVTQNT